MMITAFSANATFRVQIPLEIDGGGHLPNGSIVFTGEAESEPVDKAKECNDAASNIPSLLSSKYPDVNYISHRYDTLQDFYFVPGVGLVDGDGCEATVELPNSKAFHCVSNNNYADVVGDDIRALGVDLVILNYYGECN